MKGGETEEVGGSSSRRGAFLFIRHGGLGIKGESRSALLMLRLAQPRAPYVCTGAIYRVVRRNFDFPPSAFLINTQNFLCEDRTDAAGFEGLSLPKSRVAPPAPP